MTTPKAIKAWVVRWEWAGDHAAVDQPIAAVLRPQISGRQILRIVEILYAARQYEPDEMLSAIRRNGHQPYPARFGTVEVDPDGRGHWRHVPWKGEIVCGHNPYLVARLAKVWPAGDGLIEWEDDPRPGR
jgi:hypothetical protein